MCIRDRSYTIWSAPTADALSGRHPDPFLQALPPSCLLLSSTTRDCQLTQISASEARRTASAQTIGAVSVGGADLDEPVVLGDSFTASRGPGVNLAAAGTHREVGNEGVGGLARAVGD